MKKEKVGRQKEAKNFKLQPSSGPRTSSKRPRLQRTARLLDHRRRLLLVCPLCRRAGDRRVSGASWQPFFTLYASRYPPFKPSSCFASLAGLAPPGCLLLFFALVARHPTQKTLNETAYTPGLGFGNGVGEKTHKERRPSLDAVRPLGRCARSTAEVGAGSSACLPGFFQASFPVWRYALSRLLSSGTWFCSLASTTSPGF